MIRSLLRALATRTTFTGRESTGVLCDPNLPPNWRPAPGTQQLPPPCQGDPAELERIEQVSCSRAPRWLHDLPPSAMNLPAFLREPLRPLPDFAPRSTKR